MKRASLTTVLALMTAPSAFAQATQNANQIVGTVQFSNGPGPVRTLLEDAPLDRFGMRRVQVDARSNNAVPQESGSTSVTRTATNGSATHIDYEISLEAGGTAVHPQPIVYDLFTPNNFGPTVTLESTANNARNQYRFLHREAGPLSIEPAPDVQLDFEECAGVLDVSFRDAAGAALPITSGHVSAYVDLGTGFNALQADGAVAPGQTNELLAVHGDRDFRVEIAFTYGDPFDDLTTHVCEVMVPVGCDEIVPVDCQAPTGPGGGGNGATEIVGEVDMLGEIELYNPTAAPGSTTLTMMAATQGPLGNARHAIVGTATPSEGPFVLPNIVGSATDGYHVQAQMLFGTGHYAQNFSSPRIDGNNGGEVIVPPGTVVDLEDTFVMDPGFLVGDILFQGPPASESTCLEGLRRATDTDNNGDGYPDTLNMATGSHIHGVGRPIVAPGATYSARGGNTNASFEGSYQLSTGAFVGDYDIAVAGLDQESSVWDLQTMKLAIGGTSMHLEDRMLTEDLQIDPGITSVFDRNYCFGEISLAVNSNSNLIYNPRVNGSGGYQGSDFQGNQADYFMNYIASFGTPNSQQTAAPGGFVEMCLPEGEYGFTPSVSTLDPSGGTSNATLPPISGVNVGCGQTRVVTLELQVDMDPPSCVDEPELTIPWQATSIGGTPTNVDAVTGILNNATSTPLCTNCGVNPNSPDYTVALDDCDNTVRIEAIDSQGNTASTSQVVTFDGEAPVLTGCADQVLPYDPTIDGAIPTLQIAAGDQCDGSLPVSCTATLADGSQVPVLPGDIFPAGATTVTCDATDGCANVATCSFEVIVEEEDDDCLLVDTLQASCNTSDDNVFDGTYQVTLDTTVIDVRGADQLLIPDPHVSPNVVDTQLASGQSAVIDLTLSNLDAGLTQYCFDVVTLNRSDDGELEECCLDEVCVELPTCDCVDPEIEVTCLDNGDLELDLTVTNHSGGPINHLFLDPVDPTHGLDTSWIDVSTMNPGDSIALAPVVMAGAVAGEETCVRVTAHGDDFEECCEDVICFEAPDERACQLTVAGDDRRKSAGCSTSGVGLGGWLMLGLAGLLRRR